MLQHKRHNATRPHIRKRSVVY